MTVPVSNRRSQSHVIIIEIPESCVGEIDNVIPFVSAISCVTFPVGNPVTVIARVSINQSVQISYRLGYRSDWHRE